MLDLHFPDFTHLPDDAVAKLHAFAQDLLDQGGRQLDQTVQNVISRLETEDLHVSGTFEVDTTSDPSKTKYTFDVRLGMKHA